MPVDGTAAVSATVRVTSVPVVEVVRRSVDPSPASRAARSTYSEPRPGVVGQILGEEGVEVQVVNGREARTREHLFAGALGVFPGQSDVGGPVAHVAELLPVG